VPTLASSFLRDSMLNLLAVQAVDVSRQPCSDPRRHHAPYGATRTCHNVRYPVAMGEPGVFIQQYSELVAAA
jgi:hypothetical protein